ncbi:hydroxyacid dehydrogenase [Actinomycetospora sp. NBRC 106375]|uniref:NAD(P)-dependent oxidoreductase n=1 Tax=Actinomycetospora sp. NBRC 106375 TaxID=3032207 RepID=UPI0024A0CB10|nr:NAD(P)-dependent oxidoreductase [Actinomycetospora sp. NBRC 106375]GLZ47906.1 hydroxyacid dehydrogenase [Actinomycetospora sp. NBRC 106375]
MRIGLVGGGFAALRGALETAFDKVGWTGVEIVDVPVEVPDGGLDPVDILCPMGSTISGALMDATTPRMIQQFGVGLSGVDLPAAQERGLPVDNVSGAVSGNAVAVAEIALLHLLALLRRFEEARANVSKELVGEPSGRTLAGRTVGVLGVGDIGAEVIVRLRAFGAEPVGIGRRPRAETPRAAALLDDAHFHRVDDLTAALACCDDLVVACPLTDETRGIVGTAAFDALRPGGHVVNVARGPVVDKDALTAALRDGHLAGAGLDVTWVEPIDADDPLLAENVAVTPHVGGVTDTSYAGIATGFVASVERHLGRHVE